MTAVEWLITKLNLFNITKEEHYEILCQIELEAKEMEKNQNLNRMKEEILEAKRRLYLLLMKLNEDSITDNEVDIMFLLSKDEQIQSLFNKIYKECSKENTE